MQESESKAPSGAVGGTIAFIDSVSDQFNQLGEFTGIKMLIYHLVQILTNF